MIIPFGRRIHLTGLDKGSLVENEKNLRRKKIYVILIMV